MARRRWWLVVAAALVLSACTSTTNQGINALSPTTGPQDAVAKITYRDGGVDYISQTTLDRLRTTLYGAPQQPAPAEPILNELLTRQLLLRAARNNDIVADTQQVERTMTNLRTNPQGCASRVPQAPGQQSDPRAYMDQCAQAFGFENGTAFQSFVAEELTIEKAARQLAPKDQIKVAQILFKADNLAGAEAAYDKLCGTLGSATQPRQQPCQNAGDFTRLAKELSIEPNAKQTGGELPPFNEQGLTDNPQQPPFISTFVSNTWKLKEEFQRTGVAISQPFETEFGWHVAKILDVVASSNSALQFRDAVLQRARESKVSDLQQPDTGPVPLIGVVEMLKQLPPEPTPPSLPTVVPEPSPSPEATSGLPIEGTATPAENATATATP